jgi:predicted nuclease of predicted toxin-antitoxin system
MAKFLIDANLPFRFAFWNTPDYEPVPNDEWGDDRVWAYAAQHGLTVVTKDVDYEVLVANQTPPKVVRLCVGNLKRRDLWILLDRVWPEVVLAVEQPGVRLVRLYRTHLEIS